MNKTIIVLGMHKSGTSLVAGTLHYLGVNMGKELLGATWSNPKGHFENLKFKSENNRILAAAGGTWDNPPRRENILALKNQFSREIKNLINQESSELWGWKDPRTTLILDLYLPYLKNSYFIICRRNQEDIIKSLQRRNHKTREDAQKLIKIYTEAINKFLSRNKNQRIINFQYAEIIADPERYLKNLITFLGIEPNKKQYQKAYEFITPREKIVQLSREMKAKWEKNERTKRFKGYLKEGLRQPWKIAVWLWKKYLNLRGKI